MAKIIYSADINSFGFFKRSIAFGGVGNFFLELKSMALDFSRSRGREIELETSC